MKITKQQLKQIIKEELSRILGENSNSTIEYSGSEEKYDQLIHTFKVAGQEVRLDPTSSTDKEDIASELLFILGDQAGYDMHDEAEEDLIVYDMGYSTREEAIGAIVATMGSHDPRGAFKTATDYGAAQRIQ